MCPRLLNFDPGLTSRHAIFNTSTVEVTPFYRRSVKNGRSDSLCTFSFLPHLPQTSACPWLVGTAEDLSGLQMSVIAFREACVCPAN